MVNLTKAGENVSLTVKGYYEKKARIKQGVVVDIRNRFEQLTKQDGFISGLFNRITKQRKKCEKAIQNYSEDTVSFTKVQKTIKKYKNNQQAGLNLTNIAAYFSSSNAVAFASGTAAGASASAESIAIGVTTGAVTKLLLKIADRASNKIKGDAVKSTHIKEDVKCGVLSGILGTIRRIAPEEYKMPLDATIFSFNFLKKNWKKIREKISSGF